MNEQIRFLTQRRSVRSFTDEAVCAEARDQILQAGLYAPSAMNRQVWQFTVVTGQALKALGDAVAEALDSPNYSRFYSAPMLIITSYPRAHSLGREDCSCAMENMLLAAHALDLGAVWINQLVDTCDHPTVRKLLDDFGVPGDHLCGGCVAVGHSAAPAPAAKAINGKVVIV